VRGAVPWEELLAEPWIALVELSGEAEAEMVANSLRTRMKQANGAPHPRGAYTAGYIDAGGSNTGTVEWVKRG
jgi:hypothetical protein